MRLRGFNRTSLLFCCVPSIGVCGSSTIQGQWVLSLCTVRTNHGGCGAALTLSVVVFVRSKQASPVCIALLDTAFVFTQFPFPYRIHRRQSKASLHSISSRHASPVCNILLATATFLLSTTMVIANETTTSKRVPEGDTRVEEPQVMDANREAKQGDCEAPSNGSDSEERDTLRSDALRRRFSPSMDDTYLRELLGSSLREGSPSARSHVRRSKSCGVNGRQAGVDAKRTYRLRIDYSDEKLRERCERNTQQLLQTALDEASSNSNSTILARKALRYRKILQRMEETNTDVNDPGFDVSECMGVRWQRVASE